MSLGARASAAQVLLAPKRTISSGPEACVGFSRPPAASAAAIAEARRALARGDEAVVAGDRRAARELFVQAAQLAPDDARIAYRQARAHEDLGEAVDAAQAYCRYLLLAPGAEDAADVRGRIANLSPPSASASPALESFRVGVKRLESHRFGEADEAFSRAITASPEMAEAYFDRGLARAQLGRRSEAAQDLDRYLRLQPNAADSAAVRERSTALQRPLPDPGSAFSLGLFLPGGGQFYTGRPMPGVVASALAVGAGVAAGRKRTVMRTRVFQDPFGNTLREPYLTERRDVSAAVAAVAAVFLASATEAWLYARRVHAVDRHVMAAALPFTTDGRSGIAIAVSAHR